MFQSLMCWRRVSLDACALASLVVAASASPAHAAILPAGFSETALVPAGSLPNATAMQIAPDGRVFVCQQSGQLRVIANGTLLATPFVALTVDANGERGLLGVAFDPNFAMNQYVYVYYTVRGGAGVNVHNRVSRFTANGNVAMAGSEFVVMELDDLSSATNHNGGAINFGPDGRLYIAVGENANPSYSQTLSNRHGKMLRVNADGSIPTDNPMSFPGVTGTPTGLNRAIWAVGLRNPFTFAFNPGGSPALAINDVGGGSFEEVNDGVAGANYGWPATEGYTTNPLYRSPRHAYGHGNTSSTGCAITGGAFYNPATPTFPAEYLSDYFFADYCTSWIRRLDTATNTVVGFATGGGSPVDLKVGNDGHLYYLSRGNSTVFRVQYGDVAPTITSHPANRTASPGQSASFTVVASGTGPFTYRWQRNNVDIPGAAGAGATYTLASPQLADTGARLRVNVANSVGNLFSNDAVLTVTTNIPPIAAITAPATSLLYAGGMTVAFAGTGTDPDGAPTTLPASAFSWRVDFHHDTHSHPFLPTTTGITSGTFVVPTTGETSANVWYRIHLTVTDAAGLTHSVQRDVYPRIARLTLATSPSGLQVRLDGQPVAAPTSFDSVVGMVRTIEAGSPSVAGVTYAFTGWSDAGAPGRAIVTPSGNATYTATFQATSVTAVPSVPGGLAAVVNGGTLRLSWNRAPGAQSYRLEAGTTTGSADLFNGDVGNVSSLEGLVPSRSYFVRVRAANAVGVSAPSNQVSVMVSSAAACTAAPPAPASILAQSGGLLVALSWPVSPAATSYLLEAGTASGATDIGTAVVGNVTAYQGVGVAGAYVVRVRAANACGVSPPSTEMAVTLGCSAQAVVPAGLAVTTAGGVATFTWQPPLGATGYRMQVGSAPGVANLANVAIGAATVLPVSLAGVPAGTYYMRVTADSACGVGAPSNEVVVTVP